MAQYVLLLNLRLILMKLRLFPIKPEFGDMVVKFVSILLLAGFVYLNMSRLLDRGDYLETENGRLREEIRSLNKDLNRLRDIAPVAKDAEIK